MKRILNILLLSLVCFSFPALAQQGSANGWKITAALAAFIDSSNTFTLVMDDSSQLFKEYGEPRKVSGSIRNSYEVQVDWSKVFPAFAVPDTIAFDVKFVTGEGLEDGKVKAAVAIQDWKGSYVFLGGYVNHVDINSSKWVTLKWPMDWVKEVSNIDSISRIYMVLQSIRPGYVPYMGVSVLAKNLRYININQAETVLLDWYEGLITGIEDEQIPQGFALEQNYPNPFNPSTTIRFTVPERGQVNLKVFNSLGQEIQTLVSGEREQGSYEVSFDASGLPSGLYFYRLQTGANVEVKKMVLLK